MSTSMNNPYYSRSIQTPQKPILDSYLSVDDTFQGTFLRTLSSIATSDGHINIAEYAALGTIIEGTEQPALAARTIMHSIENPRDLKSSLSDLSHTISNIDPTVRKAAWDHAIELIMLQGERSREVAQHLAKSLNITLPDSAYERFPTASAPTLWNNITRKARRLINRKTLLPLAEECIRTTGDPTIARCIGDYLDGKTTPTQVQAEIIAAISKLTSQLTLFEAQLADAEKIETISQNYMQAAHQLYDQVSQRLAVIEGRIQYERRSYDEDLEDAVHDAGNAVELEISDRLKTDQWKKSRVWESIGRSTFGKELERRVNRIAARREAQLGLLKEDLRLFQQDLRISQTQILDRKHHTHFAKLMPRLRTVTRVMNTMEATADTALKGGTIAAAGAAGAAYFLGTGVVLPVIAPVIPFVGAAMIVAGLFKWLTDSDERKETEIKNKRDVFENEFRKQLMHVRENYFNQLDKLAEEYSKTATALALPILLEAEAADSLQNIQSKIARKILADTRTSIATLDQSLSEINLSNG